jgi:hypothetical protein
VSRWYSPVKRCAPLIPAYSFVAQLQASGRREQWQIRPISHAFGG